MSVLEQAPSNRDFLSSYKWFCYYKSSCGSYITWFYNEKQLRLNEIWFGYWANNKIQLVICVFNFESRHLFTINFQSFLTWWGSQNKKMQITTKIKLVRSIKHRFFLRARRIEPTRTKLSLFFHREKTMVDSENLVKSRYVIAKLSWKKMRKKFIVKLIYLRLFLKAWSFLLNLKIIYFSCTDSNLYR